MEVFHTGMKTKLLKFVCVWQIYAGGIQLSLRWWLLQKPGTSEIQILERIVLHPCNKKKKLCGAYLFFPNLGHKYFSLMCCLPKETKQTWYIAKSFHLDRTPYSFETPVKFRFFVSCTQKFFESLKDALRPMQFSKVFPLRMDFK